jgi:cold shock CspA family protein
MVQSRTRTGLSGPFVRPILVRLNAWPPCHSRRLCRGDTVTIDFGKVERYFEDRGFGFVSHTFADAAPKEVFFHIKTIKRTHPELAQALDSQSSDDHLYFWHEFGTSQKGQQVLSILDLTTIRKEHADEVSACIDLIESGWMNVETPLLESIRRATFDLLAPDDAYQFAERRGILEAEQKRKNEEMQRAEAARLEEIANQKAVQEKAEEEEFRQLVAEMSAQGFTHSRQVSAYIVQHSLGYKYQHISGILQMEMGGDVWNFNGGFPPKIYARLCEELGLGNQGSGARPLAFTSYKDIIEK